MDREQIIEAIDKATEPPMPKTDAVDWLESLVTDIESRLEALHEEIKNERG